MATNSMRKRKPLYMALRLRILPKRKKSMIPDHIQQDIKDHADIVEVVGSFLPLRRAGSRFKALCPFHDERTPSFYVTPSKGIFKCFSCGKGGDSIHFLMEHERMSYPDALAWLANYFGIPLAENNNVQRRQRFEPRPSKPPLPPSFIDAAIFQKSLSGYEGNNLVQWLCNKLGSAVVMEAVKAYHVGTAKLGGTTFWQVNIDGKAASGHVIPYPTNDHHRIKSIPPNWVHSLLGLTDDTKYNWVKYWFGEHLLAQFPSRKVAIVESEKTALVASIYLAHLGCIWLASCGKDGLINRDKWKVLEGREIVLYPDLSPPNTKGETPFQYWTTIAAERNLCGYNVQVNNFLETHADEFERAQKWDLADFLLRRELSDFLPKNAPQNAQVTPGHHAPGCCIEWHTSRITGQSFEVVINADNYPVAWDN